MKTKSEQNAVSNSKQSQCPVPKSRLASVLSGSSSGALVSACMQPLDVLRTRMQAEAARGVFLSTVETTSIVLKEGGIAALWKGTQPTVIRLGIGAGLHFFFLESIKNLAETTREDGTTHLTAIGAAITGGVSRAMAAMVSCPFTVVKTRMEYGGVGAVKYKNTFHAMHTIAVQDGLKGLYRGIVPTVLSNAPYSALYYMFYVKLQDKLSSPERSTITVNAAASLVAALSATLVTQPADVLRTHMQLGIAESIAMAGGGAGRKGAAAGVVGAAAAAGQHRMGSVKLIKYILTQQGLRGFFAGAQPRMIKRPIQTALVWTMYEELLPLLTKAKHWVEQQQ